MVNRGQVWTLVRGGAQHRVLIISNDEYNAVEELAIWAIAVVRDLPHPITLRCGWPTAIR